MKEKFQVTRTMSIIQKVANSLNSDIKVTFDCPSNNEDCMVPILDVKAKVNESGKFDYMFNKKPCATTLCTMKNSA